MIFMCCFLFLSVCAILTLYCLLLHCVFALTCWKATFANELEAITWYGASNGDIDDSAAGYCPFAPQERKKERKVQFGFELFTFHVAVFLLK